jgi:hypothetical protein
MDCPPAITAHQPHARGVSEIETGVWQLSEAAFRERPPSARVDHL